MLLVAAILTLSILAALPASTPAGSGDDPPASDYVTELVGAARSRRIATSRGWRTLLHYQEQLFGTAVVSLADGERFFLSPGGRRNPEDELEATLAAFINGRIRQDDEQDARCAFPARYRFLDEQLGFDETRMAPQAPCTEYDRWLSGMQPAGLTLVFPEAYINNPASMFGHTLLRVDRAGDVKGGELLAYAVNFAAETGGDGGVAFALKGIAGFYPGYFSVIPYYQKLKQYGDWENRDIWEYRLSLSEAETVVVLEHVWELLGVSFPYYFFDDNCSYHLLRLLEVAKPELRLTDQFPLWVIPVDTVRTVVDQQGVVADVRWRPSPATRLRHGGAMLAGEDRAVVRGLSSGRLAVDSAPAQALEPGRRAAVFSLAYDDLRYRFLAKQVAEEESRPRSLALLRAVSETGVAADSATSDPPEPRVRPDQGHPSARLGVGAGVRDDDAFVTLSLRPVFHELADPLAGYAPGAQIVIMDTRLRWLPEREQLRIDDVTVVDVTSITPRDAFLKPISWKVNLGLRTRLVPDEPSGELDPEAVFRVNGGAGMAWQAARGTLVFALGEATLDAGGVLGDNFAAGPGATVGLLFGDARDWTRTLVSAHAGRMVVGDLTTLYNAGVTHQVSLTRRLAIELAASWQHAYEEDWLEAGVTLKWYFRRKWQERS